MTDVSNPCCSFCGRLPSEVKKLVAGNNVFICNECIDICTNILYSKKPEDHENDIMEEELSSSDNTSDESFSPTSIKSFLDQYVIGQDEAKMVLSVAVYNHYKRLNNPVIDGVEIDKSNVLLTGPSGSGKTFLAQSIARLLNVPFAIADATGLTEAGYVGDDVESIVSKLLMAAGGDVEQAQRGIIYIDEIDKKAKKTEGSTKDVSGEGVQQALLKIIEGTVVKATPSGGKIGAHSQVVNIDTKNILFIVGGAFVGLDKVVDARLNKNKSKIGFNSSLENKETIDSKKISDNIIPDDLKTFGIIPELIGRLPVITHLDELTEDQLVLILTEPKNAIVKQYAKMFGLDDIELEFEPDALRSIAKLSIDRKTGARGLRAIIEKVLMPIQYNMMEMRKEGVNKLIITKDVVENKSAPIKEINVQLIEKSAI